MPENLKSDLLKFKAILEKDTQNILWPNTPIGGTHQKIIFRRTWSRDDTLWNPFCRTRKILGIIEERNSGLPVSIMDVGCGDSIVLTTIKKHHNNFTTIGFDANVDKFSSYRNAVEAGVELYNGYIQNAIKFKFSKKIDYAMMLNSYRSWESAQLSENEKNLQNHLDDWLKKNFAYAILTLSPDQIRAFQVMDRKIKVYGRAENDAKFVLWETSL